MTATLRGRMNRRTFLCGAGQATALLAMGEAAPILASEAKGAAKAAVAGVQGATVEAPLDDFIAGYLKAMYAPGMTLGLVHGDGTISASSFGLSDVARGEAVTPAMLFQIGSISKSFCALALLQMQDEGKLDVQRPILKYLPWLPIDQSRGVVTVHHLLTHSSGLPNAGEVFPVDRSARMVQRVKPGSYFHYSNVGFEMLGHLAAGIDGTSYASVVQRRLLTPLGMKETRPAIAYEVFGREATSYCFQRYDLPATRGSRLEVAGSIVFTNAAGCIASTPGDMGIYMAMLLARGQGPQGRVVSEAGFKQFSTPHVEAEEFGKGAHYGYGIAVDVLDGHTVLKHTGGMASFASSMQVDLEGKVAAFASINAMQGYRPNPVTTYALETMRAKAERRAVPAAEAMEDPVRIANAAEYAGMYRGEKGGVEVVAEGTGLFLVMAGERVRLLREEGDSFVAEAPAWQEFSWSFARKAGEKPEIKGAVTELSYGPAWYANAAYAGPREFTAPARLAAFAGAYNGSTEGFRMSFNVYFSKGVLVADGTPLAELGDGLFRLADDADDPDTIEFLHVVGGRARVAVYDGAVCSRVEAS